MKVFPSGIIKIWVSGLIKHSIQNNGVILSEQSESKDLRTNLTANAVVSA